MILTDYLVYFNLISHTFYVYKIIVNSSTFGLLSTTHS